MAGTTTPHEAADDPLSPIPATGAILQHRRAQARRGRARPKPNAVVECGWGRLIFGHTFTTNEAIADELTREQEGKRDIAFYLRDPHVVIALRPQELFLDPSHTYRLWLHMYRPARARPKGFFVRKFRRDDIDAVNRIFAARHMVPMDGEFLAGQVGSRTLTILVAQDAGTGAVVGAVQGVDHKKAFADADDGASLWCLAVDPQVGHPGVGDALVRHLAEHFVGRGRAFLDLSVMHDNHEAIQLYAKLGFQRVPVFIVKRKNPINEKLFLGPQTDDHLNPYAQIIVDEARRRGVAVEIRDAENGYFTLSAGGRTIDCRESLSDMTSAVAMSICDDKAVTRRVLAGAGLNVPAQLAVAGETDERVEGFLAAHGRVVVKPARGEQGAGITVDLSDPEEVAVAVAAARKHCDKVVLEQYVAGQDLRIVVINFEVVAAALRRPPRIIGNGIDSVRTLIEKVSRRRGAATAGESRVPLDGETERCVRAAGYQLDSVLPEGEPLTVRKTANLHTGGTLHDVTKKLHPALAEAAISAARAINIPVVGFDFVVPSAGKPDYAIIEANERVGLANHEPQPTAERFIDLLFPLTVVR